MSTPTTAAPWTWAPDVLAFATEQNVAQYLEPVLELTRHLFPTAQRLEIYVQDDPEIRDLRFIIVEPHVPEKDLPSFVEAVFAWNRGLRAFCPSPLTCVFSLLLNVVPS